MPTTMPAPEAMNRREQVSEFIAQLPGSSIDQLFVGFNEESYPTTSYVDEFVRQTLYEGVVERLVFVHADEFVRELAETAAARYEVGDRLLFADQMPR